MKQSDTKDIQYYNELALRAQTDQDAFSDLYEYFFPRVYNFLFSRVKNRDAADEIVSIAFEKMFRNLPDYQPDKAAFSTWLFRIAQNCMTDYFRRQQNRREATWEDFFDPADEHPTPEGMALIEEGNQELLQAMEKLKDRERRIVELKFWSGLSNQEIAAIEEISAGNVGIILFRALGNLKKLLADAGIDEIL